MKIFDRYTNSYINESNLPNNIELGRFAIVTDNSFCELTGKNYKSRKGQRINQSLLDPVNRDKHEVFELISNQINQGTFSSKPLIQGIKRGLEFGEFARQLDENLFHIEAIFHAPHSNLSRTIEKVPVSKAKRISNRSNEYLAAHTEDWLHKSLVSFHPSRILTEEVIVDEDTYENQLLIAFVTRAAQYLERRLTHLRDISKFLEQYGILMNKYIETKGWYKKVRRELELAGKVYDEKGGNYRGGDSDLELVTYTDQKLRKLRDALLKLRQFDLFYSVDQRKISSIQYHDTNVLVNHKHYRYLKKLWHLLLKEGHNENNDDSLNSDATLIANIRDYGLSIINYAVTNVEYLGYNAIGTDRRWNATRNIRPEIRLNSNENGILELDLGNQHIRFVVACSMPSITSLPSDTYILAYNNLDDCEQLSLCENIIPISLNDVESVERVAIVLRKRMFKQYLESTIFARFPISNRLLNFKNEIEQFIPCISLNTDDSNYNFIKYPDRSIDIESFRFKYEKNSYYESHNRIEQRRLDQEIHSFLSEYEYNSRKITDNLICFDLDCSLKMEKWNCNDLSYIECPCGCVVDATELSSVKFYHKDLLFSKEEMGMDYIDIQMI